MSNELVHPVSTPLKPGKPRPGRPKGARTRLLRDEQALGRHHFAFLRACLQGLDVRTAWVRYLDFAEGEHDLRVIERRRRELMNRVLRDATAPIGPPASGLPVGGTARSASEAANLLARTTPADTARALPSLEDFIALQEADPDQFSQAEWLAEYQAHYGLNQAREEDDSGAGAARSSVRQAQLQALRQLEQGLARDPLPSDAIERWFAPVTMPLLVGAGVRTLGGLLDLIEHRGPGWFKPIRGLGARRSGAIIAWLSPLAQIWNRPLRDAATRHADRNLTAIAGDEGRFSRQLLGNAARVGDLSAVHLWLQRHEATPATHRAYAKEVDRFCLWCMHVPRKPVPLIDDVDCAAYQRFLTNVPDDWIEPAALPRDHPGWKPFRGKLKPASQRHALVVVQGLFDALCDANAALPNPMARARKQACEGERPTRVQRSFTDFEWAFLQAEVDRAERAALSARAGRSRVPAGAFERRLRLILCLLHSTGLRLSELVDATLADVRALAPDSPGCGGGLLTIGGKGPRRRQLVLPAPVLAMIDAHHADMAASVFLAPPVTPAAPGALPQPVPIVCILRPRLGPGRNNTRVTQAPGRSPCLPGQWPVHRRLGANGLYRLLKRFFARASTHAMATDTPLGQRIQAASTHWLRHTFAEHGIATGMALPALQQALGHASASATRRYAKVAGSPHVARQNAVVKKKGEGVGPSNPLPDATA